MVAGSIGGAGRLNFSVIGDAVNVAARVEAQTRETGDEVLITASTHDLLDEAIEVERRGPRKLKGKEEPVELFALVVDSVEIPLTHGPMPGPARQPTTGSL